MAIVGAQRASELTGISRSTIQRHMKNGKLSCQLGPNGQRQVDVSELERVYGLKKAETEGAAPAVGEDAMECERLRLRVEMLEMRLHLAEDQITELKEQRDQWQRQASQVLLTSQHSQKEAQEYKALLAARKKREIAVRRAAAEKRALAAKVAAMEAQNQNNGFKGVWNKVFKIAS